MPPAAVAATGLLGPLRGAEAGAKAFFARGKGDNVSALDQRSDVISPAEKGHARQTLGLPPHQGKLRAVTGQHQLRGWRGLLHRFPGSEQGCMILFRREGGNTQDDLDLVTQAQALGSCCGKCRLVHRVVNDLDPVAGNAAFAQGLVARPLKP
ncbi:hypothetical protein OEG86_21925 [Hoeflea alexandrii]|nr:hypothetical protein [Hoeflea alexandrii]MCY0154447.1 hypothetical protein [Hoeflea alexandrii]